MDLGLKGKNAAITGASQGIGYAIANALAQEGCNVALAARGEERLNQAVADMQAHGVTAVGIVADLSSEDGCKAFADGAAEQLGGIDILVNNVGGMIPGTLDSLAPEDWERVLNVNLMAGRQHDQVRPAASQERAFAAHPERLGCFRYATAAGRAHDDDSERGDHRFLEGHGRRTRASRHHGQQHLSRAHEHRILGTARRSHGQGSAE